MCWLVGWLESDYVFFLGGGGGGWDCHDNYGNEYYIHYTYENDTEISHTSI